MCEIERHRYPCCRRIYEKFTKNASFCESMEPGTRCGPDYCLYAGKINDHRVGICPKCLKAHGGPYGQPADGVHKQPTLGQAQPNIQAQQRGQQPIQGQNQYTTRYGRPAPLRGGAAPTPAHPGYNSFGPGGPSQQAPRSAQAPFPTQSQYVPPHFGGSSYKPTPRPIFQDPTISAPTSTHQTQSMARPSSQPQTQLKPPIPAPVQQTDFGGDPYSLDSSFWNNIDWSAPAEDMSHLNQPFSQPAEVPQNLSTNYESNGFQNFGQVSGQTTTTTHNGGDVEWEDWELEILKDDMGFGDPRGGSQSASARTGEMQQPRATEQPVHAFSFPGSMLPMPPRDKQGKRTDRAT